MILLFTECQCNEHGETCERDTGKCHCHTKGVTGDHCEQCDIHNNYYGDPNHGSCFCKYLFIKITLVLHVFRASTSSLFF